ncbi:TIM-barrel domain-containing protein [Candidatus Phycosocius spiralis]|uniref:PA14 domain-containing protein n=1 Tax=Candidatus Phycosocius spiralis TaxID=2815099 RepID=A0ABQ4PVL6_9PROT|nr:TIM-barrel domain-containing protein [Candidatus Phycosocius spiralis]GIU67064.1 hypothetical protein PsB1_1218 [Candidatus Phycosocius spiralis]
MLDDEVNRRALLGASVTLCAAAHARSSSAAEHQGESNPSFEQMMRIEGGVRLVSQNGTTLDIMCMSEGTFSVVKYRSNSNIDREGFFLKARAASGIHFEGGILRNGDCGLHIDPGKGLLHFFRQGNLVLTDTGTSKHAQHFSFPFACDLYGLGQFRDAIANYRDKSLYLAHANMDAVNSFLVSPHGIGILWDTHAATQFTSQGRHLTFTNDASLTRYHLCLGGHIDAVIAAYRRLTGKAPLLPKWAYGFWQSQERYKSQQELTDIIDTYRAKKLPIDVMVQDWRYWGDESQFSGMVWDKTNFPDPKGMCDHVHSHHAHIIASVWPAFGKASEIYQALDHEGLLFKGTHWSGGKVLDITAPRAREIYWSWIQKGLLSVGLDGLWTDGCEPEFMSTGNRYVTAKSYLDNEKCFVGNISDNLMTFSYYQSNLIYHQSRQAYANKRPLILSRSVYPGQQAFNAITWSGDTFAGWQTLNDQIVAAQQMSLSGIPYWTCDIGGFLVTHRFPNGLQDSAYRELYVRWFQFVAFLPIFRAHGTQIRRELWAMGEDGDPHYEALKKALKLRYSLMPYIYSQAARVTFNNETFLRPLIMDFSHDPKISAYPNQYMFGRNLLIAVVNRPLEAPQTNYQEFIPNYAVVGMQGPAAEVSFFEGAHFEKLIETRASDDLKMSWFGDLPIDLKGKPYSARWKGRIVAQESGIHLFKITTQGLIKFVMDGVTRVVSKGSEAGFATKADGAVSFADHEGDDVYSFEINLKAGQAYAFELTQSQPKHDIVSLWVEWVRPSHKAELQTSPNKMIEVYLPLGSGWYDLNSGLTYQGGQTLKLRPSIQDMPVFAQFGSIIPMSSGIDYAMQTPDQIELHIYTGADGNFTLYDDEGDGHNYEQGAYRNWKISWNEAKQYVTFHQCDTTYPSAAREISFTIIKHDAQSNSIIKKVTVSPSKTSIIGF